MWPEIVHHLERWIDLAAPALEIACDRGYFIRNVRGAERWATDLRDVSPELAGLRAVAVVTRFLPYSTTGRLPAHPVLVRGYLRFALGWWLLGRQTLYVAELRG
jgi:hypothetical protein